MVFWQTLLTNKEQDGQAFASTAAPEAVHGSFTSAWLFGCIGSDQTGERSLHGAKMPGLKVLQAGAAQIKVSYSPLPTGAEIAFETRDLHLLTAIHRWFGAQLSEHGADAVSE